MINKKQIIAMDLILVAVTIVALSFIVNYARPLVIAPIDDFVTTDSSVLFEFDKGSLIQIDDNIEFTSPQEIHAEDNLVVNLKPGIYYWKIQGVLGSEIRKLTIESEVNLKLRESEEKDAFEIVNAGNTELNVDVYQDDKLTGNILLGVDKSDEVSGTKFLGEQNE